MAKTVQPELSEDRILLIAKALADPRRYEILKKLNSCAKASMPCSIMRDCFPITPATLSHHMKELETAGLVHSEKEGKFVRYTTQPKVLKAFLKHLKSELI